MAGKYQTVLLAVFFSYCGAAGGVRPARDAGSAAPLDLSVASAPLAGKDGAGVQQTLQEHSDTLASKLDELSAKFKEQVSSATGSVQKAFEDASANLRDAVEKLKSSAPDTDDAQERTKELGEKLKGGLQNAVAETRKVSDALAENARGVDSDVSETFKSYYEQLLRTAESVRGQVDEAIRSTSN